MKEMTTDRQQFCREVCSYCALDIAPMHLPKMQVKERNDERYAVLYKPYNDGKNIFSYIFYFQNKADKVAFVCTQKEKPSANKEAYFMEIESQTLALIKNGRNVWQKTAEKPLETSVLRNFIGDLTATQKVTDDDKSMLMHTVMEGMKMISKSRHADSLRKNAKIRKTAERIERERSLLRAVPCRNFIIGRER